MTLLVSRFTASALLCFIASVGLYAQNVREFNGKSVEAKQDVLFEIGRRALSIPLADEISIVEQGLSDGAPNVREAALMAVLRRLTDYPKNSSDQTKRRTRTAAAKQWRGTLPAVERSLSDSDERVRLAGVMVRGRYDLAEHGALLEETLAEWSALYPNEPSTRVRLEIVKAASLLGADNATGQTLILGASAAREPELRAQATIGLSRMQSDNARARLVDLLADTNSDVRRATVVGLAEYRDDPGTEVLLRQALDREKVDAVRQIIQAVIDGYHQP